MFGPGFGQQRRKSYHASTGIRRPGENITVNMRT